jgi:WD40-like Beta Propeller Repeat
MGRVSHSCPHPLGAGVAMVPHLDALEAQPLIGADGATFPFWSPDSRMLAFFADGKLKAIDPNGGAPCLVLNWFVELKQRTPAQ